MPTLPAADLLLAGTSNCGLIHLEDLLLVICGACCSYSAQQLDRLYKLAISMTGSKLCYLQVYATH